jgi:hypothetical protein
LPAEGRSEIATLSALQQHDRNQKEANNYVNDSD